MKRTVEVGRAVLASTTRHLELWLTTLIIISPSQHWIDLEQLSSHSLLKLLSSGKAWVGRGSGMRVELSLTLRGEPFPPTDFRELLKGIVEAPVSALAPTKYLRLITPSDMVSVKVKA
jgi:hypothetical protein